MSKLNEQSLPADDLTDLSTPGRRGTGLANLVTGNRASSRIEESAATERPVPEASSVQLDQPPPAAPAAPPLTRRTRPGRPRSRTGKPTSAIYVSATVRKRFETYRHQNKKTNLQVVLDAVADRHETLKDIIQDSKFATAPVNPLFPADPNAVRYLGGGSVQISFNLTPEQEEVLDRIGDELGFDTRSTWIAPVLNAFLPGKKDTKIA